MNDSVADLVEPTALRERAGEYLQRAGEVLRDSGAVRLEDFSPTLVSARVEDGVQRSVTLEATPGGLQVRCDCGVPSASGLCPHAMAAAIEAWHRAPNRPSGA